MTREEWSKEFMFKLRKKFRNKGMQNYQDFAHRAGISPVTLSRYMNGKRIPSSETLQHFADVLECDVSEIAPQEYIVKMY